MTEQIVLGTDLAILKSQADEVGLDYPNNISATKLRAKLAEFLEIPLEVSETDKPKTVKEIQDYAMRLVRVIITPMDITKKDHHGDLISVGNSVIPTIRRFVPFGQVTHIEQILYDYMVKRQVLQLVDDTRVGVPKGTKRKRLVPAYGIAVQPQLTEQELAELAASQAARASIEVE